MSSDRAGPAHEPALASAVASNCPNCFIPLPDPRPKFCPDCGQETQVRAPTLGEFLQQFGGHYFATEGALWRTLWPLLVKPGFLTVEYLRGRRKHYVLPLRIYLTISVLVLLAMRVLIQMDAAAMTDASQGAKDAWQEPATASTAERGPARATSESASANARSSEKQVIEVVTSEQVSVGASAGAKDQDATTTGEDNEEANHFRVAMGDWVLVSYEKGVLRCEHLPQTMCDRLQRRVALDPKAKAYEWDQGARRAISAAGAAMFVLVPLFALWLKLLYLGRRLFYTEHLVFALHLHAFWFAALGLMFIGWKPLSTVLLLGCAAYPLLAMRRVYGGGWGSTLLRGSALALLNLTALSAAVTFAVLWAMVS